MNCNICLESNVGPSHTCDLGPNSTHPADVAERRKRAEAEEGMRQRLARMTASLDDECNRAAIKWALDRINRLETVADALMEHETVLAEIGCATRKGTTMRCMPGDKCSFCRSKDLVERCAKVMEGK